MPQITVSVLIPAYNAAETIRSALDSVVAQSLQDWEAIVVDDGSTDGTSEIVSAHPDPRIRLLQQERAGVSAARNRAAEASRGELLAFLDADDLFLNRKLEAQVGFLAANPDAGSTYCWHRRIDSDGRPWTVHVPAPYLETDDFLRGFPFNPSAQMVRRRWHRAVGGFREALAVNEDRDYWLRLIQSGCRFAGTEGVHADYRVRPAGLADARSPASALENALEVIRGFETTHAPAAADARFAAFQEYALQAAVVEDSATVRSCLAAMLRERPTLFDEPATRDGLLQAIVDLATRSRGEAEGILDRVFSEFSLCPEFASGWPGFQHERSWAAASVEIQRGAREAMWENGEPAAASHFAEARRRGGTLDDRSCRLLRHQLRQALLAFGSAWWERTRGLLLDHLSQLDSTEAARAFLDSVEEDANAPGGGRGVWERIKTAWTR